MDPVAASSAASFLQSSGPWGAIVLLIGVIVFLFKRTTTLQDQIAELQEARVREVAALAANTASGLVTSSTAISAGQITAESTNRLIQQLLDTVRPLSPALEGLSKQLDGNAARIDRTYDAVRRESA